MKPHSQFFGSRPFPFLALVLLSLSAHPATLTWNGGTGGQWNDPTKWQPQQVPGAGDTAIIGGTSALAVRVDGNQSVGTLVINNQNATLRVAGSGNTGHALLAVSSGVVNLGTIELSSEISTYQARLTVSSGTLTNAVGGLIRAVEGTGGPRTLNANLANQGTLEITHDLTFSGNLVNDGTIHLAEGKTLTVQGTTTWTHRSSAITGTGTLSLPTASTFVLEQDFTPGSFLLNAPNLTVNGPGRLLGPAAGEFEVRDWTINAEVVVSGNLRVDGRVNFNGGLAILSGRTLRVAGGGNSGQALLAVSNGVVNLGTIELSSEISTYQARLTVSSGTLTNAVGGLIRTVEGTGGPRTLNANLDNQGTLEITRDLTFSGNLINNGTIHLAEGKTLTVQGTTTWIHRSSAITGTGTLYLPTASTFVLEQDFTPGSFLLNAPNLTVNGPGRLLGPAAGEFEVRDWTINAEVVVSGNLRVDGRVNFNGGLAILSGKTLRVAGGGNSGQALLAVSNGVVNLGTIELSSEISTYQARLTVSSGTLTNAVGGLIRTVEGTGGPRTLNANLDNQGTLEITRDLTFSGNLINNGTIHLAEGKTLTVQGTTTWTHRSSAITGTGTLYMPTASIFVLEQDFTPGSFLLNAPNLTVNGPGRLLGPAAGEFEVRDWTINAEVVVSGNLRVDGRVNFNGGLAILRGKTLRVAGGGNSGQALLAVSNGVVNLGTIELSSEIGTYQARLTVSSGTLTNAVGGLIRTVEGTGGSRTLNANLDNRGTLLAMAGTSFDVNGVLLNASTGILGGGGTLDFAGVTLTNEGIIAPGVSPGTLSVSGSFPLTAMSRFEAEIGGFTAGTQHDQLKLANPVTLGGAIRPVLIDDFFPKKDDAFTVLTYPSRTGTFAALDNPLPERIAWEVRYGPTSAQLVVLNTAPTLAGIPNATVNELTSLSVTSSATDQDLPAQSLTFSLAEAPAGMTIHPTTGAITWTPTEAQGPGTHSVTVRVTDNGTPSLGHTTSFNVTVHEVNVAPQLVLPSTRTADEQAETVFTLLGTDPDLPANALVYEMISGPPGATFNAAAREFRWTPTEEQGPGSFTAAFRVTDNNPDAVNEKQLSTDGVVTITVNEVNRPPVLAALSGRTVAEESALSVGVVATDPDLPVNGLTYALEIAPPGMTIHPATGAITWTPTEAQGPGTYDVTVRVTDNGVPALSHTTGFTVVVSEVNRPPLLASIPAATVHAGATFTVTLSATDPDVPANAFTYSLVSGPAGATVSSQGQVLWTPPLAAVGSVADFTVRVTEDGVPSQSDDSTFQVTVVGPVEILGTTRQGAEWTVLWRAVKGNTYRLVGSPALPAAEWTALPGEVTATGDTASKAIPLGGESGVSFLRVELVR